jgi:hypothetical protein
MRIGELYRRDRRIFSFELSPRKTVEIVARTRQELGLTAMAHLRGAPGVHFDAMRRAFEALLSE